MTPSNKLPQIAAAVLVLLVLAAVAALVFALWKAVL